MIANATGCSSIYGGNLPTTPWTVNSRGRGPAWSNSLFEDNAEFGLGMRLTLDKQDEYARAARETTGRARSATNWPRASVNADQSDEAGIEAQRERVAELKDRLAGLRIARPRHDLLSLADVLVKKASGSSAATAGPTTSATAVSTTSWPPASNVNVLVLDTEVYSNTGGQMSKSTPRGAVAKFAAGGKPRPKKDLAHDGHELRQRLRGPGRHGRRTTPRPLKAFLEAEAYDGPSLIIAYSHCIAHGYDLAHGLDQQKLAVQSGHWPLFRYNPRPGGRGQESASCWTPRRRRMPLEKYIYNETRYTMLAQSQPGGGEATADRGAGTTWNRAGASTNTGHHARADGTSRLRPKQTPNGAAIRSRHMIDLTTSYLGLEPEEPAGGLVIALSARRSTTSGGMEDAGAAASCCTRCSRSRSTARASDLDHYLTDGTESYAEALTYFPDMRHYNLGPGRLPRAHLARPRSRRHPGHRQPERRLDRRLDRLRPG